MLNSKKSFDILKDYCEVEGFKGWDPYDGLNSWVIQKTPLGNSRLFRLAWIQLFKRNPINLRPLFGIKKEYNPKGLGLFLIGYCNLYKKIPSNNYLEKIEFLAKEILKLRTKDYSNYCWGYNFDWQARAFFQPKYTPTVVATTFIADALIEAYEITKNENYLNVAISASKFVLNDLNRSYDKDGDFTFSYSPLDKTQVYNAGLLGAKLLCLVYKYTSEANLLTTAKSVVNYVCKRQSKNGSWAYGTLPFHQWVDNFHTGYNLECLRIYQNISGDESFNANIEIGMSYYLNTFFTEEGMSKYYNDKTYPIDIHAPAQLIVTLHKCNRLSDNKTVVDRVLNWTIDNMQTKEGYFIYQKRKLISSRIPYIRWAQGWMFYALSFYNLDNE
ncbi:delta-aminolevulinic acid dehydratase [Winogradskyella eckloniae]|uniref:delta-aminolevulinic acid dehydratase n=1 Tax=Winogradskyella eckloniae TaxID=1089306 RepID=UPI0015640AF2|nr:delta-aminolevulinic acid dehydratase [Winogradskyella eckloniae]NRD18522.1 delta-aminolevulinic acid dehydratase [Winogradskyella eckloniae]